MLPCVLGCVSSFLCNFLALSSLAVQPTCAKPEQGVASDKVRKAAAAAGRCTRCMPLHAAAHLKNLGKCCLFTLSAKTMNGCIMSFGCVFARSLTYVNYALTTVLSWCENAAACSVIV